MSHRSPEPAQPTTPDAAPPMGCLVIDKPYRKSSTSMVTLVKARFRAAGSPKRLKVGHGGTLDPLATGVLVILVGRATKLTDTVMAGEKRYTATIDLAHTSPSDDLETERTAVPTDTPPTPADIDAILPSFTGKIQQTPPTHSAVHVAGRRAYDLARAGTPPTLEPRTVEIHELRVESYDFPTLTLGVRCGKGTYIRSLARDLGRALGTGGTLADLRRTRVGPFDIEHAITPDKLPDTLTQHDLVDPAALTTNR